MPEGNPAELASKDRDDLRAAVGAAPDSQAKDAILGEFVKTKCKNNAAYLAGMDDYIAYLHARKQSLSDLATAIDHAAAFQAWVGTPKAKSGAGKGRLPSRDNVRGARHLYGEGVKAGYFGESGAAILKAVRIVPLPPADERAFEAPGPEKQQEPGLATAESEWRPQPAPTTAPLPATAPTTPLPPATAPTAPTITPAPTPAPEPTTAKATVTARIRAAPKTIAPEPAPPAMASPSNARLPYFFPTALPSYHGTRRKPPPPSRKTGARRLPVWPASPVTPEGTIEEADVLEETSINPPPDSLIEETASAQTDDAQLEVADAQPESAGAPATGRPTAASPDSPTLRVRRQGSRSTDILTAPFVQSGRLVAIGLADDDEEMIEMRVGRTTMRFFLDDFSDLLQGSDNARYLLNDAVEHNDYVEIRVTKERLSYRNDAQYARVSETREKETAEEARKAATESAQRLEALPALLDEIAELRKKVDAQDKARLVVETEPQAMSDFQTRFKRYANAYRIEPEPREMRDAANNVLGWTAYVTVREKKSGGDLAHKIQDRKLPQPRVYETEKAARDASSWLGLHWLEQGATAQL